LQKFGVPRRVYYDNGAVYRSHHMRHIAAGLGLQPIVFTRTYRPMGHGKIEALNRLIRSAFLAELKSSAITTLDALNEAFLAWGDLDYNRVVHSETGEAPLVRWRSHIERIEYADEARLRDAFLWSEKRTPDKAGVVSLFGTRYQVGPPLARRRITLRYDPEQLDEIEAWHQGRFVERVRPLVVHPHRRPRPVPKDPAPPTSELAPPAADYLGHLVQKRRTQGFVEPSPRALTEGAQVKRQENDQAVVDLLAAHLDPRVLDEPTVRSFLDRYGPFDPEKATDLLTQVLQREPADHHVLFYLEFLRDRLPPAPQERLA
jgi:hypothetical protein